MKTFVESIFLSIANKLGIELKKKNTSNLDYFVTNDISITAAMSGRIATLTLMDSDVNVSGENKRAKYLNEIVEELEQEQLKGAVEVALGTGDCLIKPYTDGDNIGFDLVPSTDFIVTDNIGKKIKGCLIKCDEYEKNNHIYERVEYHHIEEGSLYIEQLTFIDGKEIEISRTRWEGIEDVIIPNTDYMLFGRIKCPMINRGDLNSVNGVPITYGMDKVVKSSVESYNRFNREMEDKETMVFADKTIINKDQYGNFVLPKGKRRIFQSIKGGIDNNHMIHEYSPEIRSEALKEGIEQNFKMLELLAGLSAGILTAPTTNYATATEMKANLELSFAFIQSVRRHIESAIDDLLKGTYVLMNANNITPMGEYEVIYNWSDSYIQEMRDRLNALLQAESIGAVSKAEVRAFVQNEPLDLATEKVEEIKETKVEVIE